MENKLENLAERISELITAVLIKSFKQNKILQVCGILHPIDAELDGNDGIDALILHLKPYIKSRLREIETGKKCVTAGICLN